MSSQDTSHRRTSLATIAASPANQSLGFATERVHASAAVSFSRQVLASECNRLLCKSQKPAFRKAALHHRCTRTKWFTNRESESMQTVNNCLVSFAKRSLYPSPPTVKSNSRNDCCCAYRNSSASRTSPGE